MSKYLGYKGKTKETLGNLNFEVIKVIDMKKHLFEVIFEDGTITQARTKEIMNGSIKSPMLKSVYGVGFLGIGAHVTSKNNVKNKTYDIWCKIIKRCYCKTDKNYRSYGAKGIKVSEEWHCFQNFADWYENNKKQEHDLDKDILGGDIYSKEKCIFIHRKINSIIQTSKIMKIKKINKNKFKISEEINGQHKYTIYKTLKEAEKATKKSFINKIKNTIRKEKIDIDLKVLKLIFKITPILVNP